MTIEQKIFSKLEPHAKRIKDGEGNDFDYLPAVLFQITEEQKRQAKLLDDTAKLLASIKNAVDAARVQSKEQITEFEAAAQRKMEQMETAINDKQNQLLKFMRLLIAGLVTSTVMIGLAVAILQRH